MQVYTPQTGYCADTPIVLALGNFDGVHVGHATLLRRAAALAREKGVPAGALIFERDPENIMANTCISPYITTNAEKARQIHMLGVDRVIYIPFDRETSSLSPEAFVARLRDEYRAAAVVCGFHYRFGYRAAGKRRRSEIPVRTVWNRVRNRKPRDARRSRGQLHAHPQSCAGGEYGPLPRTARPSLFHRSRRGAGQASGLRPRFPHHQSTYQRTRAAACIRRVRDARAGPRGVASVGDEHRRTSHS